MTKNTDIYGIRQETQNRIIESTDSVVDSVIDQHVKRALMGQNKYGQTLDRTDLSVLDYLQHAKEEAMDLALYLEKIIQLLKEK
jgi:hypothetical protein